MKRLDPARTVVVLVDIQEKLCCVMPEERMEHLLRSARILIGAARELGLPAFYTEQYPRGLGATIPELHDALGDCGARGFEKNTFSACGAEGFVEALPTGATSAIVIGMEAHVCVFQSVRDLVASGLAVHVPVDGVVSRRDDHRERGLALCERAGAITTTTETAVFDLLERAGTPAFKALAPLMR